MEWFNEINIDQRHHLIKTAHYTANFIVFNSTPCAIFCTETCIGTPEYEGIFAMNNKKLVMDFTIALS